MLAGKVLSGRYLAREMVQLISGAGSSPAPPPAENISPAPAGKVRP